MRSDEEIKRDVEAELRWVPDLDESEIAVAVKDGVVTLTGFVKSYSDKWEAERAAKRVAGVLGVVNDIEVRIPNIDERPDPEIARDAVMAIKHQLPFSYENIKVTVKNGWVTLEGEVEWNYQREAAEAAVRRVRGVKGITNKIELKPMVAPTDIKRKIEEAFRRNAELDAQRVTVEVKGGEVILRCRALLGRARGGGTGRLVVARRDQGDQPDHREPVARLARCGTERVAGKRPLCRLRKAETRSSRGPLPQFHCHAGANAVRRRQGPAAGRSLTGEAGQATTSMAGDPHG
jgi:osmotically-inducible protein OsmY